MSNRFITYVIIGVAFGFTQLWFAYWVVKLVKEKQRILKARRNAGATVPATGGAAAKPPVTDSTGTAGPPASPAAGPPAV